MIFRTFLFERAGKTWDAVAIPGIGVSDLSQDALMSFRKKAVKNKRMTEDDVNVTDELLLRNLKLMDGDYLTRAAILLFHPDPESFSTGAHIKIGYFGSVGVFGEDEEVIEDLQYHDVVDGPIIMQVDDAIDKIFGKYFKALIDYEGIQRTETYMLNKAIVRELLLNAINHKDYASGVPIQVSIYDDHIEIFNMGEWPKRVPTDQRIFEKHDSIPRNPKMADVAFRSGDVEPWGRGFIKIKTECMKMKAPLPVIDASNGGVSVSAVACEQYLHLLRHEQYGQIGADGKTHKKQEKGPTTERSSMSARYTDYGSLEYKELMDFLDIPRTSTAFLKFLCNDLPAFPNSTGQKYSTIPASPAFFVLHARKSFLCPCTKI